MPVFLAGYYGNRVWIADSTAFDLSGTAVFAGDRLPEGIYTLIAQNFRYDFLIDEGQNLRFRMDAPHTAIVTGNPQTEAYAAYCRRMETYTDKQAVAYRDSLAEQYAGTFLAAYLVALQPVQTDETLPDVDLAQMMIRYRHGRQHFFDHMNLSDARLLHTPLYHETVRHYFSRFVTQHPDTLIALAYKLLEKASENTETFFFMADFLTDYGLRNSIENLNRFLLHNRYMLSNKALFLLSATSRTHFVMKDTERFGKLPSTPMYGIDGQLFDAATLPARYRIYYFWNAACPQCLSGTASWQALLKRHPHQCAGIAVNVRTDDFPRSPESMAQAICVAARFATADRLFLTAGHAKIIITDASGDALGIFASVQALDDFLKLL
jgi:hypothetical protein